MNKFEKYFLIICLVAAAPLLMPFMYAGFVMGTIRKEVDFDEVVDFFKILYDVLRGKNNDEQ